MSNVTPPKHWITWGSARGYPLSSTEERFLLEQFRDYAGTKPERSHKVLPDRQVASLLLTLIRDGATPQDLEAIAPNLNPHDLESVYVAVAGRLHSALNAWHDLVETPAKFDELAEDAGRVMPHLVNILRDTAPEDRPELVTRLDARVKEATHKIDELEKRVHTTRDTEERCNLHYSLARADSCLWDDYLFLPQRVGQLTPTRLTFILGELT